MRGVCRSLVLLLAGLFFVRPSQPATLEVTHSLSRALSAAQDGDTIRLIGPGTFPGPIEIRRSLSILGVNQPVVDGGGTGTVITVTGSNVVLRGIAIKNSGRDLNALDSAVMLKADGGEVSDCLIDAAGFGIFVRGANHCRIERNLIHGAPSMHPSSRGNGIQLWKTRNNLVCRNTLQDTRDGIYFSYADRNEIVSNDIRRTRFAVHYMYSHYNRLLSNSMVANAVGATLMFSQYSLVQGNMACANSRHGMLFKQLDNSQIIGNLVAGQNRGFFIQQATMNRFINNVIGTNDIGIYLSNGSEQNVFAGNSFINNVDQLWQPDFEREFQSRSFNTFYENGRGNYWSDYAGADADGNGIGDTPYHETDVFGFLLDRYPEARIFALSPAVALLRKTEEVLPILNLPGVTDLFPLMRSVRPHP